MTDDALALLHISLLPPSLPLPAAAATRPPLDTEFLATYGRRTGEVDYSLGTPPFRGGGILSKALLPSAIG